MNKEQVLEQALELVKDSHSNLNVGNEYFLLFATIACTADKRIQEEEECIEASSSC